MWRETSGTVTAAAPGLVLSEAAAESRRCAAAAAEACRNRGLVRSAQWLAELAWAVRHRPETPLSALQFEPQLETEPEPEPERVLLARSLLETREYERAAFFASGGRSRLSRFLHWYARYLAEECRALDSLTESSGGNSGWDASKRRQLRTLYEELRAEHSTNAMDGYQLYLFGVVLRKLELQGLAQTVLQEAVAATPWLWAAWLELAALPRDRDALEALNLPQHCMAHFFMAHAYLQQKSVEEAIDIYENLKLNGFDNFTYLNAQLAVAYHDMRDAENAITTFKSIQQVDPYRLDNLDIYSHLLYVKEMRTELANLAHKVVEIDKYRVETCCVIGNYYSLRSDHQKAVVYFQRALKLNPNYLSAWILMGHEFIELQNTNAAIQSYRQAIEVNRNDYRAWNGLGQAYEILGLNGYCLYYYARAAQQCPNDSRMLVALGEAFEKLEKIPNALKCYHRAHSVGDIEGMAILKLAKLYDKLSMQDSAAAAYSAACLDGDTDTDKGLQDAHRYLANYHLKKGHLDHAAHYAFKCLDHEDTKEEGKSLLKTISDKRALNLDGNSQNITEDDSSKICQLSDAPTTPKPSCAIALNYTPQSADSSRYKL
ncbi:uncharacterized protein LOC143918754 [Arctopsyche grandis]|uniref:uncharacterized protein LOC143918754 n=1 Tax=Arctopsyche grandis TaxID=121162 RepID=UPI00406D8C8C